MARKPSREAQRVASSHRALLSRLLANVRDAERALDGVHFETAIERKAFVAVLRTE